MVVSEVHCLKAWEPIDVTVLGMVTATSCVQLSKAFLAILITAVDMDIMLAELQPGSYLVAQTTPA